MGTQGGGMRACSPTVEASSAVWPPVVGVPIAVSGVLASPRAVSRAAGEVSPDSEASATSVYQKAEEIDAESTMLGDEPLLELDPIEHISLVLVGNVDAGKATLRAALLSGLGDPHAVERGKECQDFCRETWCSAFLQRPTEDHNFRTVVRRYTILAAPGLKTYEPIVSAEAVQPDVGILVVSARKGELEVGLEIPPPALLIRAIGAQHLVVAVNKMDDPSVRWSEGRFEDCVVRLRPYLHSCGFAKNRVVFLPIAALRGDNVHKEALAEGCSWWRRDCETGKHGASAPTLLAALDRLAIAGRGPTAPLRMSVLDRYLERGWCVVTGRIEQGCIRVGDEVLVAPTERRAFVDEILIEETHASFAKVGESVLLKLRSLSVEDVRRGSVLCAPWSTCHAGTVVRVQLVLVGMLAHRPLFTAGYQAVLLAHAAETKTTCTQLLGVLEKGRRIRRTFARAGQLCVATLTIPDPICVETFETLPALGRIALRDEGRTIALGTVVEIVQN